MGIVVVSRPFSPDMAFKFFFNSASSLTTTHVRVNTVKCPIAPIMTKRFSNLCLGCTAIQAGVRSLNSFGAVSGTAFNAAWKQELASFEELRKGLFRPSECSQAAYDDLMAFTMIMVDMYAGIPARYAREAAPHHLNLGMRFAHAEGNASLLRTAQHFDVFSLNCYEADPVNKLDGLHKDLDMPILVGEFHFGALDAGLPHPSLFRVANQYERGKAYERYQTRTAAHCCGVGSHYFAYNDQPTWGRYDGENYQFGLVDICQKPYEVFTAGMRRANERIYDVMQGVIGPEDGETKRL